MSILARFLCFALFLPVFAGCASTPPIDPNAYPTQRWTTLYHPQGALKWDAAQFNDVTIQPDADTVLVAFDPNTCTLDAFADAGACTLMAGPTLNMRATFTSSRPAHHGATERLFTLSADDAPALGIVFRTPAGADIPTIARLLAYNDDGGIASVLNLALIDNAHTDTPLEPATDLNQRWHTGYRPQRAIFTDRNIRAARFIPDGPRRCRIILDPNSCTLDEFGTPTACTRMSTQLVTSAYELAETRTLDSGAVQQRFEFRPDLGAAVPFAIVRTTHPAGRITAKLLLYNADGQIDSIIQLVPGRAD